MPRHWLYGEVKLNVPVEKESDCCACSHFKVCHRRMFELCSNHVFGTSDTTAACDGCTHRYSRWDKDQIPCFHCKHFHPKAREEKLVALVRGAIPPLVPPGEPL